MPARHFQFANVSGTQNLEVLPRKSIEIYGTSRRRHAAAANGDALIAPDITARLLAAFADVKPQQRGVQPVEPLTDREEEGLVAVATGHTNTEIAAELYISLSTVKSHLAGLIRKLDARNRVEIAMWAYEMGRVRD